MRVKGKRYTAHGIGKYSAPPFPLALAHSPDTAYSLLGYSIPSRSQEFLAYSRSMSESSNSEKIL